MQTSTTNMLILVQSEENQIFMTQEGVNVLIRARTDFWQFSLGITRGCQSQIARF